MTRRTDLILRILARERRATVLDLASALDVSPATVRQDLSNLEREGLLRRVHGGAELDETDDLSHRMAIGYDEKLRIARKAVESVREGDTLFVESGSTSAIFVKELASFKSLTVITSNAFIARSVARSKGCTVVLIGGVFQEESESLVGNLARLCIERLNFDKVFLGVDGFTFGTGFTGRDLMRAEIAEAIVAKGREVFVLSDSSKFGRIGAAHYCDLEQVGTIITDRNLGGDYVEGLRERVRLVLA